MSSITLRRTAFARGGRLVAAAAVVLGLVGFALAPARAASGGFVYLMPTTGTVDSVMAEYIAGGIAKAAQDGAAAVVIELDTPGGALDATSRITGALLDAPIPTIVWVAPAGGRAASAGTFITLAAAVALMAQGTNIGAASPIDASGQDIGGTLGVKVKNDAIANITAIAEARHRNVAWAVSTVDKAISSPASEAVRVGAVDGIADSMADVLRVASGRTISVLGRDVTLALTGADVRSLDMNPFQAFLHVLSDPNVAFLLFTVGTWALIFEVLTPHLVSGIIGGIFVLLAFIGFGSLPLNLAGVLLLGFALALFVADAFVTSHGLLTVGGLVAFGLGASALYTAPQNPEAPEVAVAIPLILFMTGLTAVFMTFITLMAIRTRRLRGSPGLVGEEALPVGTLGEVRHPLAPLGSVYAGGEEWTARSADGRTVERDAPVRVVARDGLIVVVEPVDSVETVPDGS
jgi:membrane-bound serine protease (ClpP class)